MKINNIHIKPKKMPYFLLLVLLSLGSSVLLGLISFGGMYALIPLLSLASASLVLSMAYEGEIYFQNIKGALNKLWKNFYLNRYLAKEFLLENFPENVATKDCPQFFKDYKAQLELLAHFEGKSLDKKSKIKYKKIKKTLSAMEKWFAVELFQTKGRGKDTVYNLELRTWLASGNQLQYKKKLAKRQRIYKQIKMYSTIAGLFMGFGTIYLCVEAFSLIPFMVAISFAAWPLIILPVSIIAGASYGMLTFNALTDLVNNDTIRVWFRKMRDSLQSDFGLRSVLLATTSIFLILLATALTICTAGTWWTVVKNARPLFHWMTKIPQWVMGVLNPVFTASSALIFIMQNTSESIEMVRRFFQSTGKSQSESKPSFWENFKKRMDHENNWQKINPFRIVLKSIMTPLRIVLFLGHLVGIGVTTDRMPGLPQIVATIIAIISEGFEDLHYFVDTDEGEPDYADFNTMLQMRLSENHEHSHDMDLPSRVLKYLASPLYALAAFWDSVASQKNEPEYRLDFISAWNKQFGIAKKESVAVVVKPVSSSWQKQHALYAIEYYKENHFSKVAIGKAHVDKKIQALDELSQKIATLQETESVDATLNAASKNEVFSQHRMFAMGNDKTSTQNFVEELAQRVAGYA